MAIYRLWKLGERIPLMDADANDDAGAVATFSHKLSESLTLIQQSSVAKYVMDRKEANQDRPEWTNPQIFVWLKDEPSN